jgi:uncharacterized protein YyaL (SSP411 family)
MRFSPRPNRAPMIHWYEWGEGAFRAAREQNKPVMLFLGAFWCGYCQRMDEEAFSQTENIALLRAYFISIRAENAQRPDLDARYNQNGWPTLVFMSPAGEAMLAANYLTAEQLQEVLLRVYIGHQQGVTPNTVGATATTTYATSQRHACPGEMDLLALTKAVMAEADRDHGGYGNAQKFIQSEPNDFLLARYEAAGNPEYLEHVCLTLDRMREQSIHDRREGGYFRTSTGPDWNQPHREKLLAEQAGMIRNCLHAYRINGRAEYARMAEETIGYLDRTLYDASSGAFYGCEDFLRTAGPEGERSEEFFTVIDRCLYTDANALAVIAYLDAAVILQNRDYAARALGVLQFLRENCVNPAGGMFHYFDGAPRLGGWLGDQVLMGRALLGAHRSTGVKDHLVEAIELARYIVERFRNPQGGYFDIDAAGVGHLRFRLTLIEQNGPAASFFLQLGATTGDPQWREAASWSLSAFEEDRASCGVHAAAFGVALGEFLESAK